MVRLVETCSRDAVRSLTNDSFRDLRASEQTLRYHKGIISHHRPLVHIFRLLYIWFVSCGIVER